jgi:hypothetical protein
MNPFAVALISFAVFVTLVVAVGLARSGSPRRRQNARWAAFLLAGVAGHLGVLAALCCFPANPRGITAEEPPEEIVLIPTILEEQLDVEPVPVVDNIAPLELPIPSDPAPSSPGALPAPRVDLTPPDLPNLSDPLLAFPGRIDIPGADKPDFSKPRGNIFDIPIGQSDHVCYIVDRSGSMSDLLGSSGGNRLDFVNKQLLENLAKRNANEEFFVIYFGNDALPMPGNHWRQGPEGIGEVRTWIRSIQPDGGTEPMPAFEHAFQLNPPPRVIVFLTDGEVPFDTPARVTALNTGKKVTIHTMSFKSNAGQALLKQIVDDNGGEYRDY